MNEEGFKHFTGVDGSQGMLDKAKERGLYHCLKKALLGSDLLPVEKSRAELQFKHFELTRHSILTLSHSLPLGLRCI